MSAQHQGRAIAGGWALLLAPPLALILKAAIYPGWMMFVIILGAIPLLLGYALQIVVAANGMFRERGVFNTAPGAQRGIIAAWISSAGILLAAFFLVDGGDDGTYGSAFTELVGSSSTASGEALSTALMIPAALAWLAGWAWLVIEWIALLVRARRQRAAEVASSPSAGSGSGSGSAS